MARLNQRSSVAMSEQERMCWRAASSTCTPRAVRIGTARANAGTVQRGYSRMQPSRASTKRAFSPHSSAAAVCTVRSW